MFEIPLTHVISAFAGGVLMFLAPCTLPLIPAFFASITSSGAEREVSRSRALLVKTILFSAGFTFVFVTLGILSGFVGNELAPYTTTLSRIGGGIIIVFGLSLFGVFTFFSSTHVFGEVGRRVFRSQAFLAPMLFGAVFALGWSPCAGPILVSILLLAANTQTAVTGGALLLVFSLGLMVPFALAGMFLAHMNVLFRWYERYAVHISKVSGAFLVALGVMLVFGSYMDLAHFGTSMYLFLGYTPMCAY